VEKLTPLDEILR